MAIEWLETIFIDVKVAKRVPEEKLAETLQRSYPEGDLVKLQFIEDFRAKVETWKAELSEEAREEALKELREEAREEALKELREEAREEGEVRGLREGLVRQLRRKFHKDVDTEKLKTELDTLDFSKLVALGEALLDFEEPADFQKWLAENR